MRTFPGGTHLWTVGMALAYHVVSPGHLQPIRGIAFKRTFQEAGAVELFSKGTGSNGNGLMNGTMCLSWQKNYVVPIALRCAVWGPKLSRTRVLFQCDNLGLVATISKGSSRDNDCLDACGSWRSYSSGIKHDYIKFCNQLALPTTKSTLLLFVTYLASLNLSHPTIKVYLAGVRSLHVAHSHHFTFNQQLTPQLQQVLKGIQKQQAIGSAPMIRRPITIQIMAGIKSIL